MSNKRTLEIAMLFNENAEQLQRLLEERRYTYVESGATYSGQWLGGFRHGKGKITFTDGAVYEGDWNLGHAQGEGKFT